MALVPRHARTLSLHDHILQAYLPYFAANHFHDEPDVDLILDDWLRSHPDVFEPTHHYSLRERDFRNAFYLVLDCMDEAEECGEHPIGVSRRMIAVLDDEWADDMRFGSGRGGSKAQRLFRALAEVSSAAGSRPIGTMLRTFFLGWLHEIAEEDAVSLAGWCSGVLRSSMDVRDKQDCARALSALRPDIHIDISGRGTDWLSLQAINVPIMTWPRRRRPAGRLWWDDEHDRRIQRLIDEEQAAQDRAAERRMRKVNLTLGGLYPYNPWPRSISRGRPRRKSLPGTLRQSRSPVIKVGKPAVTLNDPGRFLSNMPPLSRPRGVGRDYSAQDPGSLLTGVTFGSNPVSGLNNDPSADQDPGSWLTGITFGSNPVSGLSNGVSAAQDPGSFLTGIKFGR